jgi:flavin-dependent dehydrogenase
VNLIVDATGRGAALGRRLKARQQIFGRLVALVGRYAGPDSGDSRLYVEAAPDGWWYALRQTGGRRIAVYLTDADLLQGGAARRAEIWREALARTSLVQDLGPAAVQTVEMADARSLLLEPQAGPGWIALGDAAMAFDPLSAAGITKALADARATAAAILANPGGEPAGWEPLLATRARRWSSYLAELRAAYMAADLGGSFWERRTALEPSRLEPYALSASSGNRARK